MRATMKLKPGATFGLFVATLAAVVQDALNALTPRLRAGLARKQDGVIVLPGLPSIFHSLASDGDHAGLPAPTIH